MALPPDTPRSKQACSPLQALLPIFTLSPIFVQALTTLQESLPIVTSPGALKAAKGIRHGCSSAGILADLGGQGPCDGQHPLYTEQGDQQQQVCYVCSLTYLPPFAENE